MKERKYNALVFLLLLRRFFFLLGTALYSHFSRVSRCLKEKKKERNNPLTSGGKRGFFR